MVLGVKFYLKNFTKEVFFPKIHMVFNDLKPNLIHQILIYLLIEDTVKIRDTFSYEQYIYLYLMQVLEHNPNHQIINNHHKL